MIKIPSIQVSFHLDDQLIVPVNYQHLLQSFVYSLLPHPDAIFFHEKGYQFNNRVYKLFTFSKIQSPHTTYNKRTKEIIFSDKIFISISSILPEFVNNITNELLLTENFTINKTNIRVENISYNQNIATSDQLIVKAMSPITVYSTYQKRDGAKITHYFSPFDKVFEHLIEENFVRKYQAYTGNTLEENDLIKIRPVQVTKKDKIVTKYKSTWITGWTGIYELKGKEEYLTFLLNAGLGSKNSSGFGFISPLKINPNIKEV